MKKLWILLATFFYLNSNAQVNIPSSSPFATVSQKVGRANVNIEYSRPSIKGRLIFGNLVPYGKVWRTGANKITKITFDQAIEINGSTIKPGSYGLYTIPNVDSWKIILNRDSDAWGAYDYDPKKDVISFNVIPLFLDHREESLTIEFSDFTATSANIFISWDRTGVKFPISQNLHKTIMDEIAIAVKSDTVNNETLSGAATYYYDNEYDLPQALKWSQQVLLTSKNYWNYELVGRIAAKMGNCDIALANAEKSLKLSIAAKDDAYIIMNKTTMALCGKK